MHDCSATLQCMLWGLAGRWVRATVARATGHGAQNSLRHEMAVVAAGPVPTVGHHAATLLPLLLAMAERASSVLAQQSMHCDAYLDRTSWAVTQGSMPRG